MLQSHHIGFEPTPSETQNVQLIRCAIKLTCLTQGPEERFQSFTHWHGQIPEGGETQSRIIRNTMYLRHRYVKMNARISFLYSNEQHVTKSQNNLIWDKCHNQLCIAISQKISSPISVCLGPKITLAELGIK